MDFKGCALADNASAIPGVVADGWRRKGAAGLGEEAAGNDNQYDAVAATILVVLFAGPAMALSNEEENARSGSRGVLEAIYAGSRDSNNEQCRNPSRVSG